MMQLMWPLIVVLIAGHCTIALADDGHRQGFVWPGNGQPLDRAVWGHADGIQIGLAPTPGPHGLMRVYMPHFGQPYPHRINFISVEPMAMGQRGRDQSELAHSKIRDARGLRFVATDSLEPPDLSAVTALTSGKVSEDGNRLRIFVHTESFPNGSKPIIEVVFDRSRRSEVDLIRHLSPSSAPLAECVLSATMGNYAQLRRIQLVDSTAIASALWGEETKDALHFYPWRTFQANQLPKDAAGRTLAILHSDVTDYREVRYGETIPATWRYRGLPVVQYWRAERDSHPILAVNARDTYWQIEQPIPGGRSIENFELRQPFRPGQRITFGIAANIASAIGKH